MPSTISAGTTAGTAFAVASDTSGELQLRTNGTTPALTLSTAQNATFAGSVNAPNTFGFKNRIINGAMVIDQRNAGASVTASSAYTLDRWICYSSAASKYTVQQNAGSVTPPAGFRNYLGATSTSAYSVNSTDFFSIEQPIEGFNAADLGWGTANAQTVTLSFWVRSSLTGTFGGAFYAGTGTLGYAFSYTISAANTWEQKSVVITGPTTGTWASNNTAFGSVCFSLGMGSSYSWSTGSWLSQVVRSATGATSVVGTNGATFYITGVQLERGSAATSFDYRPYGTELMLCQRYCEVWRFLSGSPTDRYAPGVGWGDQIVFALQVEKRAASTVTITGAAEVRDTANSQRVINTAIASNRSLQLGLTTSPAIAAGTLRMPSGLTDAVIVSSEL